MDWSKIKKLSESQAKNVAKTYLTKRSFKCEEIDPTTLSPGKLSPDYYVYGHDLEFLCEVKTPEHKLDPITKLYKWDTTFYKLKSLIHKAVKQFEDYDKEHKNVRVIAFTSNHPQLNYSQLIHNIKGKVEFGKTVIRDLDKISKLNNWQEDLPRLELVLWFQVNYITNEAIRIHNFLRFR